MNPNTFSSPRLSTLAKHSRVGEPAAVKSRELLIQRARVSSLPRTASLLVRMFNKSKYTVCYGRRAVRKGRTSAVTTWKAPYYRPQTWPINSLRLLALGASPTLARFLKDDLDCYDLGWVHTLSHHALTTAQPCRFTGMHGRGWHSLTMEEDAADSVSYDSEGLPVFGIVQRWSSSQEPQLSFAS